MKDQLIDIAMILVVGALVVSVAALTYHLRPLRIESACTAEADAEESP
jgi:hypothetical protein